MSEMIMWSPGTTLEEVEKQIIIKAYAHYRGVKTTTANALGIAIRTLDAKLAKYKLEDEERVKLNGERQLKRDEFLIRSRGIHKAAPIPPSPNTGIRLESFANASSQHAMPVSERQEVQAVSPKPATKGNPRKISG